MARLENIEKALKSNITKGRGFSQQFIDDIDFLISEAKKTDILEEAIDSIEHAMNKVGWNNSRIEDAFDEMNEKFKELHKK